MMGNVLKGSRFHENRRKEAQARQEQYDGLTPVEKIAALDARLGKGMGAAKERARLTALLTPKKKKESKR